MERGAEVRTAAWSAAAPTIVFALLSAHFPPSALSAFTAIVVANAASLIFSPSPLQHLVWAQAALLGSAFFLSLFALYFSVVPVAFALYASFFTLFHWMEYMATALWAPQNLKPSSFLLNHSREYWIAAVGSWLEFWIEFAIAPDTKRLWFIVFLGFVMTAAGEWIRTSAMRTAGRSFNHVVQDRKGAEQELVKDGLYSWVRHPAYTGWFLWSVGTQMLLGNPICLVVYTVVVWRFFQDRIHFEEQALVQRIFGSKYVEYQAEVPSGIPFVEGYIPDNLPSCHHRSQ